MELDKNDFFRQATMRVCGNLSIETAMWHCLQYLETVMPVTGLFLNIYERDQAALRTLAHVTRYEIEKLDQLIPLSDEARDRLEYEFAEMKMREVLIINRPELHSIGNMMTQLMEKPNTSIMVMRLELEDIRFCALVMYVAGKNQYTREHTELMSLLHDPFAIAMSNAIKHEEVSNLRDRLADDNRYLHRELLRISGDELIGEDGGLKGVMRMVRQVAPLNSPVLLMGETGVGKEVIANAIHNNSPRKNSPFIKVNCGAIPESLLDSELFGHEKGAFTGAISQKRGRFERANKGTLLLDEIGELPPQAQVRFLRVLQNKEIERVGGTRPIPIDIRVIASTHRDLEEMVKAHQFREDLWFRLNVFPIRLPPLRDRSEDIPDLIHHFVARKSKELGFHAVPFIAPGSMTKLTAYPWPGNVRELENIVERALIQIQGREKMGPLVFEPLALTKRKENIGPLPGQANELMKLDEAMSIYIQHALRLTSGKIEGPDGAAECLGINAGTLRSRMKKMGIPYRQLRKQFKIRGKK